MLGAVVGDIIGSAYEFGGMKSEDFPLFSGVSRFTDDAVMTLAVARALMECMKYHGDAADETIFRRAMFKSLRKLGYRFPNAGYGRHFTGWLMTPKTHPYNILNAEAAVRVSPISWAFDDIDTVEKFAEASALVTHMNPEALTAAKAVAGAVFLARTGQSKDDIRGYITGKYGYDLSQTIDDIRPECRYDPSCPGLLSQALTAFLEGESFEDVMRKGISLGGASDTIAAISGAIAEPLFGIPTLTQVEAYERLHPYLKYLVCKWEQWRD